MSRWTRLRGRPRRRQYARSPLSRLEWGTAGRHRRRVRRGLIGASVLVVLGAAAAAWLLWFRSSGGAAQPAPRAAPRCATARLPGRLGSIAWVERGKLQLVDLET